MCYLEQANDTASTTETATKAGKGMIEPGAAVLLLVGVVEMFVLWRDEWM